MHNHRIPRRDFMGVALAGAAVTQGAAPQDRQSSMADGAPVWLNMTQAKLDAAYDQSVWASNLQQVTGRCVSNSASARARLGSPRRYAYGPTAVEALDVFATKRRGAPVHIFIHGGQWRVGLGQRLCISRRSVRARRGPFRRSGLRIRSRYGGRPDTPWRTGEKGRCVGPQQRIAIRWRPVAYLCVRPFIGSAPGRRPGYNRLAAATAAS